MLIASMLLVALHAAQPATSVRVMAVGDCIPGPHAAGRVRRMPGQAMTSHKPRDPKEDGLPHCGDARPASPEGPGDMRPPLVRKG